MEREQADREKDQASMETLCNQSARQEEDFTNGECSHSLATIRQADPTTQILKALQNEGEVPRAWDSSSRSAVDCEEPLWFCAIAGHTPGGAWLSQEPRRVCTWQGKERDTLEEGKRLIKN
ncbi:hypothetical protein NDU88_008713 [Pleurodeles waltl]|uniref:Uncharacterized protein n=1 Tax=Pleurodeles waltl TaxID=8319 RepID=A0AAV7RYU8_PLEWA|nr:hypothetical protein NDU88_008713 [Pleurodeles waltl]